MAVTTAIDFEAEVKRFVDLFDHQKYDELKMMFAENAQGVDEISKGWLRGRKAIDGYFRQLEEAGVGNIRSKLRDFKTRTWDDVALVTCFIEQDYDMEGERVHINSPLSVLFRRDGDWRIELIHAVPLPE